MVLGRVHTKDHSFSLTQMRSGQASSAIPAGLEHAIPSSWQDAAHSTDYYKKTSILGQLHSPHATSSTFHWNNTRKSTKLPSLRKHNEQGDLQLFNGWCLGNRYCQFPYKHPSCGTAGLLWAKFSPKFLVWDIPGPCHILQLNLSQWNYSLHGRHHLRHGKFPAGHPLLLPHCHHNPENPGLCREVKSLLHLLLIPCYCWLVLLHHHLHLYPVN